MVFYPDCDYFGDERDSEYAPTGNSCEGCYRYDICQTSYLKEHPNKEVTNNGS